MMKLSNIQFGTSNPEPRTLNLELWSEREIAKEGWQTPARGLVRKRGQASTSISLDALVAFLPELRHAASGAHPVSRSDVPRDEPRESSAGDLSGRRGPPGFSQDAG